MNMEIISPIDILFDSRYQAGEKGELRKDQGRVAFSWMPGTCTYVDRHLPEKGGMMDREYF